MAPQQWSDIRDETFEDDDPKKKKGQQKKNTILQGMCKQLFGYKELVAFCCSIIL